MEVIYKNDYVKQDLKGKEIIFLCFGTDRGTGDSLGPLCGTYLEDMGYEVIGTLEEPLHAMNIKERISGIRSGATTIAIDACLGQPYNVGNIYFGKGSLKPGAGVKRDLGSHGDFYIKGTVNVGGFMEYLVLQNTRLNLIMNMSKIIVRELASFIPIPQYAATKED